MEIRKILPHRDPILLVQSAEPDPDRGGGRGEMLFSRQAVWDDKVQADFPEELVLEGVAQIAGVLASLAPATGEKALHLLTAFRNVLFTRTATADRPILAEIRFLARVGGMALASFRCRQGGELIAEGEVSFA